MDLMAMASQLLSDSTGQQIDTDNISGALSSLLGDGQGGIDLAGLANKMASSGELGAIVSSWLGDGANSSITPESVLGLLGEGQVSEFASKMNTDTSSAAATLADMLPQLVDKASSGGSLLESAGGLDGLLGAAKSFLSK
jgi:uncharacterized protein YidB (DUF937 family)